MTRRHEHYQSLATYYAERARYAGARYLNTGQRIDKLWAGFYTRQSLRYLAKAMKVR